MPFLTTLLMVACLEVGQDPEASKLAETAVVDALNSGAPSSAVPNVSFQIRDITMTSPEWRGKMLAHLEPISRREGAAVWAIDDQAIGDLLKYCQTDGRSKVVQVPRMMARLGEPVRMSSETSHKYVAHLTRVSDGPPNEGSRIAFSPEIDEVHDGIRVNLLSSHLKGPVLFAHVAIEENRLVAFHTVKYTESVKTGGGEDPNVAKASLLSRIRPDQAGKASITGTIQVPAVTSRRIEGEWMIPSEGALLISLGPIAGPDKGFKQGYEERLIAITAHPEATEATEDSPADPSAAAFEAPALIDSPVTP